VTIPVLLNAMFAAAVVEPVANVAGRAETTLVSGWLLEREGVARHCDVGTEREPAGRVHEAL
jgi:hypothetical protein